MARARPASTGCVAAREAGLVRARHGDGRKDAPEFAVFTCNVNEAPLGHHVATAREGWRNADVLREDAIAGDRRVVGVDSTATGHLLHVFLPEALPPAV